MEGRSSLAAMRERAGPAGRRRMMGRSVSLSAGFTSLSDLRAGTDVFAELDEAGFVLLDVLDVAVSFTTIVRLSFLAESLDNSLAFFA